MILATIHKRCLLPYSTYTGNICTCASDGLQGGYYAQFTRLSRATGLRDANKLYSTWSYLLACVWACSSVRPSVCWNVLTMTVWQPSTVSDKWQRRQSWTGRGNKIELIASCRVLICTGYGKIISNLVLESVMVNALHLRRSSTITIRSYFYLTLRFSIAES